MTIGRRRLLVTLALPLLAAAPAAAQDALTGIWLTDDGASKVEVGTTKGADGTPVLGGKVVWLKEPGRDGKPLVDANNADATLRGRPILGLPILWGFKPVPGGSWSGGSVYSPRAGKSFSAELSLGADGRLRLDVKAGLLSKTEYWTR